MANYGDIRVKFQLALNENKGGFIKSKGQFLVKNRQSGNVYMVNKPDLSTHVPASKEEVEVYKKEQETKNLLDKGLQKTTEKYNNLKDQVAFENEEDQKSLEEIITKVFSGKKLSADEIELTKKYFKVADKDRELAVYMPSRSPGNFKQNARIKLELGTGEGAIKLKKMMIDSGVEETESVTTDAERLKINNKDIDPNKVNKEKITLEKTVKKNDKDEVESIQFGSHSIKRLSVPSDLRQTLKESHPNKSEKELDAMVDRISTSIERNNMILDQFANMKGEIEVLETVKGADVNTEEGRNKVLDEYPTKLANAIKDLIGDKPTKAEQSLLDDFEKLKSIKDSKEYDAATIAIVKKMESMDDIKKGAPSLNESMVYLSMIKQGYPVYLPASANMAVSDIVSFPDLSDLDPSSSDYSKKLASNVQYTVNLQTQGGISVKKDGGAASAAREKLDQTLFKNTETKNTLVKLIDNYQNVMGSVKRQPNHEEGEKQLAEIEKWAKDNGLWDGKPIAAGKDGKTPADWAQNQIDLWTKKGKFKGSKEHVETVRKSLELHARQALLLSHIYNKDCRGQLFGNINMDTKKESIDFTDGINSASLMKPLLNSGFGFNTDKEGNVWPAPNNVYGGNLVHGDYDHDIKEYVLKSH